MKNTIDSKKAIAVICAVSVFIVGGCILGRHIIGGEEDSEVAAVTSPSPSPSASPSSAPGYSIDTAYDGIVGNETATPAPSSVPEPPQNSPAAETKAPAAPAGTKSGSSGTSAPSGTNSETASKPTKTAPSSDQSSGDSSGSSTPAGGSTNSSGQVYVPGFGWVTPSTSGNSQTTSHGDGDGTIIGTMG